MAFALYTQSLGVNNALANVTITETVTGLPALILTSSTGGLLSDRGQAQLDASGNLSVYIDTARTWVVKLVDEVHSQDSSVVAYRMFNSYAELQSITGVAGVSYIVNTGVSPLVNFSTFLWDGSKFMPVQLATQVLTPGAAPAVDLSLGTICTLAMGANATVTLGAPTNIPPAGTRVSMFITQDATGGRTLALNAAYIMTTALSNTGNTANKKTVLNFTSDGTALVSHGANTWY
jgi:hypothetical protein